MRVFLYERVSSEEQVKHGYSLDAQDEALREFCERNNHVILGVYRDEGISGRKPYTKRPAMVQLLRDVETIKPQMILFTKLDRWFRNIKEYYKVQDILDKYKVDWKAINEEYDTSTASGRLYVNIKLSIAQDEADRTSERIKDVQNQLVMQGRVLGGATPFGYKIENKHVVFSDDIKIVKEMIDYYMIHRSVTSTARRFNGLYGLNFTMPRLALLFRNPLLKGEYRGNTAFCEPLLSVDEWDALQTALGTNVKANTHRCYILAGLMRCPLCGGKMVAHADGKGRKYYRCYRHVAGICDCKRVISERKVESWLLENVETDFDVEVRQRPKKKKESPKKYREQLKRLNDIYLLGNISEAEYRKRSADLQRIISELSKESKPVEDVFKGDWKDVYKMLDEEHRRAFWKNLVKEVKLDADGKPVGIEFLY